MAKLVKIYILGIRSFGPHADDMQQLKFTSPVTLLLGQNGCGKTTVIEAIRYACTGDLPPGTANGQGFVNDPKITKRVTNKGQVRLKLIDPQGNEITICRVCQVTVKSENTMKFTSTNPTIRIVNPQNEEISTSGRCIDAKNYIATNVLNVSQSVLNNVIFCHQENSSWPLEAGQKVKEKFDEIFDAQMYNKCADEVRKQIKERKVALMLLEKDVNQMRITKDEVEKCRQRLEDKRVNMLSIDDELERNRVEIEPIATRIREIQHLESNLAELQGKRTAKRETKKGVIEHAESISKNIKDEFDGTDAELREKIESFENIRKIDEQLVRQLEERKVEIDDKVKSFANGIQECQNKIGKFRQELDQHRDECVERTTRMDKAIAALKLKRVNSDYGNSKNCKFLIQELNEALESSEMILSMWVLEKDQEEVKLQKNLDEIREQFVSTKQKISSKSEEIELNTRKIDEIESELNQARLYECTIDRARKAVAEAEEHLSKLEKQYDERKEMNTIVELKATLVSKERELEIFERDVKVLQQNDLTNSKIEAERLTINTRRQQIESILKKRSNDMKLIFGDDLPERNLKNCVDAVQTRNAAVVDELTQAIGAKEKEIAKLEAKYDSESEKICNCRDELKSKKKQISELCKGRDFAETLDDVQDRRKKLHNDKGHFTSARTIYEEFMKVFQTESPCCPICRTDFKEKKAAALNIANTIKAKLQRIPANLNAVELELRKTEEFYDKLQQLKPINDDIRVIAEAKLPQLEKDLGTIKDDLISVKSAVDDLEKHLVEPAKVLAICTNVISDTITFDQCQNDIDKAEKTLDYHLKELLTLPSNKSKHEIENDIDTHKNDIQDLRNRIDSNQKRVNMFKDRLQKATNARGQALANLLSAEQSQQKLPHLESQRSELSEKVNRLKNEIKQLEIESKSLKGELDEMGKRKTEVVSQNKISFSKERRKINDDKKLIESVEEIQSKIERFLLLGIDAKLKSAEDELGKLIENTDSLNVTRDKILDGIAKKKEILANGAIDSRSLHDNVLLREKQQQMVKLDEEIAELDRQIGESNYKSIRDERHRLEARYTKLQQETNNLKGQKQTLDDVIIEIQQDLERPYKKNAYKNYLTKYYQLVVAKKVMGDLISFNTALEKSILEFHKVRMVQINKSIRDHWRNIYRGNDIDYIEIRTDFGEGKGAKRSYNYYVVQVKGNVPLEMRGRCSAGQKVLACLIIRMAIAEILSANCGILALDEPTTNLDKENIESLCGALSRIIHTRQNEKNFQLIIITHDEVFLNTLTRSQSLSHYYRVTRNNDGFSIINKETAY